MKLSKLCKVGMSFLTKPYYRTRVLIKLGYYDSLSDEEFLNNLPVIPLLQEYDTVLSHSSVRGINANPSGDIYLKYINMQ